MFENKMNQPIELEHEGKINFTPVSVKDEQRRVEHLAHTHVLNAEQTYWKQDCYRMEDQGEEVSWYSFIGNLNPGRHDVYEAQTISKTKTISSMCFIHGVGSPAIGKRLDRMVPHY